MYSKLQFILLQFWVFSLLLKGWLLANTHNQFLTDMHDSLLISFPPNFNVPSCLLVRKALLYSWLTALPLVDQGFALHKGAFCDALSLRYGWQPQLLPSHCICGKTCLWNMHSAVPLGVFLQFDTMNCITSLLCFCLRSVTMSVLNRICNHCLGNSSITDQPMLKMVLAWMLVQRVSGVGIGGRLILT